MATRSSPTWEPQWRVVRCGSGATASRDWCREESCWGTRAPSGGQRDGGARRAAPGSRAAWPWPDRAQRRQSERPPRSVAPTCRRWPDAGLEGRRPFSAKRGTIIIIIIIVKPSGSESSPGCSYLLLRVGRGEWVAPLRQRLTRGRCPPSEGYVSSSPLRLESSHGKLKKPLCCIINCKQSRGSSHPSACISFSVDTSKIPL